MKTPSLAVPDIFRGYKNIENGTRDVNTSLSWMVCHPWAIAGTCYDQSSCNVVCRYCIHKRRDAGETNSVCNASRSNVDAALDTGRRSESVAALHIFYLYLHRRLDYKEFLSRRDQKHIRHVFSQCTKEARNDSSRRRVVRVPAISEVSHRVCEYITVQSGHDMGGAAEPCPIGQLRPCALL